MPTRFVFGPFPPRAVTHEIVEVVASERLGGVHSQVVVAMFAIFKALVLGVRQFRIAPRSPWQNGFAERWVGTLRRELLDHTIVFGERHLLHLACQHVAYYNTDRPHTSLDRDAPISRRVVALPRVGGLHHRYSRAA